jgi:hypothetical protein
MTAIFPTKKMQVMLAWYVMDFVLRMWIKAKSESNWNE